MYIIQSEYEPFIKMEGQRSESNIVFMSFLTMKDFKTFVKRERIDNGLLVSFYIDGVLPNKMLVRISIDKFNYKDFRKKVPILISEGDTYVELGFNDYSKLWEFNRIIN